MSTQSVLSVFWHSVEPDSLNPRFLDGSNPTISLFRDQLRFLTQNYTPISIHRFLELREQPSLWRIYKRPSVLLTFDDGFKNIVENALPVLDEFGVPAVFFVLGEVVKDPGFVPWYVERNQMCRRTRKTQVLY